MHEMKLKSYAIKLKDRLAGKWQQEAEKEKHEEEKQTADKKGPDGSLETETDGSIKRTMERLERINVDRNWSKEEVISALVEGTGDTREEISRDLEATLEICRRISEQWKAYRERMIKAVKLVSKAVSEAIEKIERTQANNYRKMAGLPLKREAAIRKAERNKTRRT